MKNRKTIIIMVALSVIVLAGFFTMRSSKQHEYGIGPIKEVKLENTIDERLVTKGKQIFDSKCVMCHNMNQCKVGPLMQGVTKRRKPGWIMNMMLNPVEMSQSNAVAADLVQKYGSMMPNQNISEEDARALLEYFRSYDNKDSH